MALGGSSTSWTMGSILSRLVVSEADVEICAGPHRHRGVYQGAGEFLVMLKSGSDVVAIQLAAITSVRVIGGDAALPAPRSAVEDLDDLVDAVDLVDVEELDTVLLADLID
ncbi:MAG: hypothetical protein QM572_07690 [Nocardioides sp.]|uniref:hypothetical protein n=1 Tax=Nocardioides sp. TaxID=35761 RepID=UPI0039E592A1